MQTPSASVVFSTYNQPAWLEKTLLGFAAQDRKDFEVVIADDGSRADTREQIDRLRPQLPFELRHVWQPDEGFRKCHVLNKAIAASRGEYLIFTDGDCIPRRDFVSAHMNLREMGRFLSGGYFKLPMAISEAITPEDIASNRVFELTWLRSHGLPWAPRNVKLAARGRTAGLLDALVTTRASWNGHNASCWAVDLLRVNGFDERMGYGGEDRELGERLQNAGLQGKRIRHRAIVVHLDHPRGYVRDEVIEANRAIRAETKASGATWTRYGIRPGATPGAHCERTENSTLS